MGMSVDGIELVDNGWFLTSAWVGKIKIVNKNGKMFDLFETGSQGINSADIGINKGEKIFYVPTFKDNRVIAYKYRIPENSEGNDE